jgi:hypothetical protein
MSAVRGIVSGLIAYGLGEAQHMAVRPWQALFIVEGSPTFAVGVLTLFVLPGRPENGRSRCFSDEEQEIIISRRNRFTKNANYGINLQQVKA